MSTDEKVKQALEKKKTSFLLTIKYCVLEKRFGPGLWEYPKVNIEENYFKSSFIVMIETLNTCKMSDLLENILCNHGLHRDQHFQVSS